MRNTLVPLLLLATIALSSSKVLPILSMSEFKIEPLGFDGHQNDNIFSNKYKSRSNLNDILYNIDTQEPTVRHYQETYSDPDEGDADEYNSAWKNDNYDVKGYRKEQWHNYPRQLDRLNRHIYEDHADKRNLDPDDPRKELTQEAIPMTDKSYDDQDAETAAAIINPLIILKIHLACMRKDKDYYQYLTDGTDVMKDGNDDIVETNPKDNVTKVKREGKDTKSAESQRESSKNRVMNKRIFSLWSRLQSLNQRGHELHHRRHLYALYGLPDSAGSGVLTAETRATFMRPPGSPLRWG